jgi:hypothetical protein
MSNGIVFFCGAQMNEEIAKRLALCIAVLCVRNTCIEDIHAGIEPCSQIGDFSDAKVVTPYGEIPWNKLSRIRNDEMREFMKEVVDRLYTVLLRLDDPGVLERLDQYARRATRAWDAPKNLTDWLNDWLGEVRH